MVPMDGKDKRLPGSSLLQRRWKNGIQIDHLKANSMFSEGITKPDFAKRNRALPIFLTIFNLS